MSQIMSQIVANCRKLSQIVANCRKLCRNCRKLCRNCRKLFLSGMKMMRPVRCCIEGCGNSRLLRNPRCEEHYKEYKRNAKAKERQSPAEKLLTKAQQTVAMGAANAAMCVLIVSEKNVFKG